MIHRAGVVLSARRLPKSERHPAESMMLHLYSHVQYPSLDESRKSCSKLPGLRGQGLCGLRVL